MIYLDKTPSIISHHCAEHSIAVDKSDEIVQLFSVGNIVGLYQPVV